MNLQPLKIFAFLFIIIQQIFSQVIITEVMYDLVGTDSPNEFIELYNTSSTNVVDLTNWKISDKYSIDNFTDTGDGFSIPPLGYAVILEGDYDIPAGIYNSIIPAVAVLIKVDDNSIGNALSSSDSLYLRDNTNTIIDSYGWTDIAPDGFSLEKIRLDQPSTINNWKASKDSLGTPGLPNSVVPLTIDGEIITANTVANPIIISINEKTYISVDIANIGLNPFTGNVLIQESGTTVGYRLFNSINTLDTSTVTIETMVLSSGEVTLDITLEIAGDLDLSNNTDTVIVSVKHEPHVFLINEFHAQPVDDQIEFVEILHRGNNPIDMKNWRIADSRDGTTYRLPEAVVQPGEFVVIAYDSSLYQFVPVSTHYLIPSGKLPALNNNGDGVRIFDPYNTIIDSLTFDSSWDITSGYSTEKILPQFSSEQSANWKHSVATNKMTPGLPNSVIPYNIDGAIQSNITFNPIFPKPGELVTAKVLIQNVGIQSISGIVTATFNNNIIGSANTPNLSMGETSTINIPFSNLPSGRHKILFELSVANDENPSNNSATKKVGVSFEAGIVKFNEFHALPTDNSFEFVELVSSRSIVIDGWRIADNSTSNLLPITYIKNGDYIVLASDTSLKPITNPDAKYLIPYGGLPTLNNTGDNIYLVDMNHTIIDSLKYGSGWPVVADSSTEKLRPDITSNDPVNWKTSTASVGMTPGYVNSNYLINYDGEIIVDSIYHLPEFPKSNESIQLIVPITNHGAQAIAGNIKVYENDIEIGNVGFTDIARRDTSILQISLPKMDSGIHPLKIQLEITADQNLENNNAADTIFVSYNFGDVLINEFLPRPISPQAEFVELVSFDNVNLTNWSIADKTAALHHFNGGGIVADKYVVLSEDPAFATIIPQEAIFVEVTDFPSLNNYGDAIYLRDFTDTVIDSLIYTTWWELATGISTEKIQPEFVSNDSTEWKISVDSTGWTPGRPNSVVAKNIDGAILTNGIIISPEFPESTEPILITIPITNNGLQPISGNLFIEENSNILTSSAFSEISMSDIILIELEIPPMLSSRHEIRILLDVNGDEGLDNNIASIPIFVSYNFGDITINEFLADPESPLSEFIEIYTHDNVDLNGWTISDNRMELEEFSVGLVNSGTYVVIGEDTSLTPLLPSDAIFTYVNNFPSLNNSDDGIFLYDFTGKIIDSLHYNNSDWQIKSGQSTEKLHPEFISNDYSKWKACEDTSNVTIGRINSVVLQNVNGAILPVQTIHQPEYPHPSESISFDIAVVNNGLSEIGGEVKVLQNGDELGAGSFNNLISEDTTFVSFNIEPLLSGNNLLEILLEIPGDMNSSDNQLEYNVYVSYSFGTVVFNEFLAKPDTTQAEFVEIISFNDIDLTGWSISDNSLKQYYFAELMASANQPIVIAADSVFIANFPHGTPTIIPIGGWPTLNNESDGIFLYDATGAIIDSLHYNSDWPIADGRSSEKFRPEFESYNMNRWGIAVNAEAMTPGIENSLHFDEIPQTGAIAFEANTFSPNGDGIDDELLVKYKLPYEQGIIKLQIFDMTGRNVATPYWNVHFPQEGLLKWDGKREDGNNARIGIYIVKLIAKDPATGKTWEKVKTVVLAKQL